MKINKLMLALLAGAMFASCSDDRSNEPTVNPDAKNSGYISIAVGMPASVGSRANDQFDDGLTTEYSVRNIAIAFFTGREESAQFLKAYNVTRQFTLQNPSDDQITSSNRVTFPIDVTETPESLWALALVNYTAVFTVGDDHTLSLVGGDQFTGTIADFLALTTDKNLAFTSQANFFMTNTPYTTAPGSGASTSAPTGLIHLLAAVDKEKIEDTEEKAKLNPAAEVFVERAVAKVEVLADPNEVETANVPEIGNIEWLIDNTEPSSYIVRNLRGEDTFDPTAAPQWMAYTQTQTFLNTLAAQNMAAPLYNYRFVGNTVFNQANPNYRLYYGVDPNGNGIDIDAELNVTKGTALNQVQKYDTPSTIFGGQGAGKPQYCNENTFDVAHMDYANTTRVILKVTYKGGNFYTRGIDRTTMYKVEDAQMTLAHFVFDDADVVQAWTDHFDVPTTVTIESLIPTFNEANGTGTAKNDWMNVKYAIEKGRLIVTDVKLFDGKGQAETNAVPFPDGVNVSDVIARINAQVTFNAYEGGVAYYAVRIKHFGDDLTPWIEPDGETTTTADSYGEGTNAANNYLGRYGVLRNNWYQLNVSNISKLGEPTIGDLVLDKTPDDKTEPEKSISCKINILSWAKRSQNVDL